MNKVRYRILAEGIPFEFEFGNISKTDSQAKSILTEFEFKPTSYTLQRLVKREWQDVCRRDIATGYLELPNGAVCTPDGKFVSGPAQADIPVGPAPDVLPLTPGDPIPGTGGPPDKAPDLPAPPMKSTISSGGTVKPESWRLRDGGTGAVIAEGPPPPKPTSVAPHLEEMHRIATKAQDSPSPPLMPASAISKLSAVDIQESPPWESDNIAGSEPVGDQEIDNGSPEPAPVPAPAARKGRTRQPVAKEAADEF